MKVIYSNQKAEKSFAETHEPSWRYPSSVRFGLRLLRTAFENAPSFHALLKMPSFRPHRLEGKLKGLWSFSIKNTGYRVLVIPCNEQEERITDGDILNMAQSIKVIEITKVTNHYEQIR